MRQNKIHKWTRRSISSRKQGKYSHRVEISAGGLVYRKTHGVIQIVMIKDSYGKWTFPKGHVQEGESYTRAAVREIFEETGLRNIRRVAGLGNIDIWFRDNFHQKGVLVRKFIHYFLFEAGSNTCLIKPLIENSQETIRALKWVNLNDVIRKSAYKDMQQIVLLALQKLGFDTAKSSR